MDPGVVPNGLIAFYPFEDDVKDYSGNNFHGIMSPEINFENGIHGKGLAFDGSHDYITFPAEQSPFPMSAFTIVLWINSPGLGNITSEAQKKYIFAPKSNSNSQYDIPNLLFYSTISDLPGGIRLHEMLGYSFGSVPGAGLGGFGYKNNWIMFTAQCAYGYRDEQRQNHPYIWLSINQTGGGGNFPDAYKSKQGNIIGGNCFYLGSKNDKNESDANRYEGLMDEVRIYNRILSEYEIKQIYDYYHKSVN